MSKKMTIEDMTDPRKEASSPVTSHDLITADELAEYLRVSTGFIYKLARQRRIPTIRIGRSVRFDVADVEAVLHDRARGVR